MGNESALAEVRRRKAALNRVEAILAHSTPSEIDLLRRVLATCSDGEIATLREILFQDGEMSSAKPQERANTEAPLAESEDAGTIVGRKKTLVQQVEDATQLFDIITSPVILGHLQKRGVKFRNQKPIAAVSAILSKLAERKRLIPVQEGTSHTPAIFRKAGGGPKP